MMTWDDDDLIAVEGATAAAAATRLNFVTAIVKCVEGE